MFSNVPLKYEDVIGVGYNDASMVGRHNYIHLFNFYMVSDGFKWLVLAIMMSVWRGVSKKWDQYNPHLSGDCAT